ncbi:MAG: deoxyribodipyrimidine photo-lyase [Thermodesulfobacteriota bacterium]
MIQKERIKILNQKPLAKGAYVLYWMQAAQRTEYNHALEYAIIQANELRQPLIVFFGITDRFPEANERHYFFMMEGLREVKQDLQERNMQMVIWLKSPEEGAIKMAQKATLVVVDRGYLRIQRGWRDKVASHIGCPLIQVEGEVIIPVEEASPKEEYSAATLRPKIKKKLSHFLTSLQQRNPVFSSLSMEFSSFDIMDLEKAISKLNIDRRVKKAPYFQGGTKEAKKHLQIFLEKKLDHFGQLRNDPTVDYLSHLSPYLHFGQISPLYIALKVLERDSLGKESFLEELIIRRELSRNFVFYNPQYDSFGGLPEWAKKTLKEHQKDRRPYLYALEDLEAAQTHDIYWNAAQKEMMLTGKMHGYMRMYWGKKIMEWSKSPEDAFRHTLYLNNKYEIDGRDPNGFAGVAWCFGKHDRPWEERPIFGKVRFMNEKGLERKFAIKKYVEKIMKVEEAQKELFKELTDN